MNSIFIFPGVGSFSNGSFSPIGPTLFPDGSVSSPSITFVNDTDTGIYRETTNILGFTAGGGIGSVAVDSSGLKILDTFRIGWTNAASLGNPIDLSLFRDAANVLAQRNGINAQRFNIGQGNTALAAGRLAMGRDASAAFAPGAGYGMLRWETGTNAGSLKLVVYSGTSTVGVTVIDNIGSGN